MSSALVIPADVLALQQGSDFKPEEFKDIAGAGINFLPRLQLFTANSQEVKEMKISMAHYGLVKGKDTLIPLGPTVPLIAFAWRAKAMNVKAVPRVLAYFNKNSEEFKQIVEIANEDSNKGCMYGPEFLVWLGTHGFATFFFGSKTARNSAPQLQALLPKPSGEVQVAVATAKLIKNTEHSWHGPEFAPSSQTIEPQPDPVTLFPTITEFLKPKDSVPEAADAVDPAAVGAEAPR